MVPLGFVNHCATTGTPVSLFVCFGFPDVETQFQLTSASQWESLSAQLGSDAHVYSRVSWILHLTALISRPLLFLG